MREFVPGLVSVVTPVYNGEGHLARMLDSVLAQTYPSIQMILADDGSTDGTLALAEGYRERFATRGYGYEIVHGEHSCAAGAMNLGLPWVRGEYLIWPDSDDVLEPESVAVRVEFLRSRPEYHCVRSLPYYVDGATGKPAPARDESFGDLSRERLFWDILWSRTFVCCGCYMLESARFFQIYPESRIPVYPVGQNFQMLLPYLYRYPCPTIQRELYGVWQRSGSHSRQPLTREQEDEKYRAYEAMTDEIAEICGMEKKERAGILEWQLHRRVGLAVRQRDWGRTAKALFQMRRLGLRKRCAYLDRILISCIKWRLRGLNPKRRGQK
ncbi:glycosyltransferase family 2 protein [Acutalibacter sp. 1XD8-33]|uniref:glycosyltransferase family A protein n=1 Tax=Acutalibacter sp. 1XD8-33 TaxID=2320081 RepID=UPI000EA26322|nr:glycosyltransferase family 2 protein [Acutalibacter sp. 1XD8-33]RKJ41373.1 glycosyltransferase family 2 protein [Acutalibacter sp. 1XD8-33]